MNNATQDCFGFIKAMKFTNLGIQDLGSAIAKHDLELMSVVCGRWMFDEADPVHT